MQPVEHEILQQWTQQQDQLRAAVRAVDDWGSDSDLDKHIRYIGGLDISFHDNSLSTPTSSAPPPSTPPSAVASLVVFSFPDAHLVYQDHLTIQSIPQPYIPGFLAFREVPHYQSLLERALATQFYPSVVLVDGCGLLHPRQCGSACHLGVHAGIRAVGVAKNVLAVDGGCQHNKEVQEKLNALWECDPAVVDLNWLQLPADAPPLPSHCRVLPLYGMPHTKEPYNTTESHTQQQEVLLGAAVSVAHKQRPVYVSVGHRVSLATAVRLVVACCRYRIPEPIRQADILSRAMLLRVAGGDGL